ncbi:MAG: hypothetical protein ABI779_05730 [Acidobacteriota bacterium]
MLIRKFFGAVVRDWGSLVTGAASVPLTIAAFYAQTTAQRTLWAIFAFVCFVVAAYRIWAMEYRRAEDAETRLSNARPWVTIDGYSGVYHEDDETGEEYLVETLNVVNRGAAPAVSISLPAIEMVGQTARLLGAIPSLGPNEHVEVRILHLDHLLDCVKKKVGPPPRGQTWSVRIPVSVEYRDLVHRSFRTEHAVSCTARGIRIEIVHPADLP